MKLREYFQRELKTAYEEVERKGSEITRLAQAYPEVFAGSPVLPTSFEAAKVEQFQRRLLAEKEQLQIKADSLKKKLQEDSENRQNLDDLLSWWEQLHL